MERDGPDYCCPFDYIHSTRHKHYDWWIGNGGQRCGPDLFTRHLTGKTKPVYEPRFEATIPRISRVVLTTRPICPICLIFSKSLFVWPWLIVMRSQCCSKCSVSNETGRQLSIESVKDSGGDVWQLLLRMWMVYCSDLGPDIDTPDTIRIFSVSPTKCYNSL
jgi:hypothetical protein